MAEQIRICIIDDQGVIRELLTSLIESTPKFKVVGAMADPEELINQLDELNPDVVIVDMSVGGKDGLETVEALHKANPEVKILILTAINDATYTRRSVRSGAIGIVLKTSSSETLLLALQAVARGSLFLDPAVSGELTKLMLNQPLMNESAILSAREKSVVIYLAEGLSVKQISKELAIKSKTVETYKARALEKLRLTSRAQLIRYAFDQGWLKELTQ